MTGDDAGLARVEARIRSLRVRKTGEASSPHKFLFLLALARLYEEDPLRENRFPLDAALEEAFRAVCQATLPEADATAVLLEYPFYHLASDRIWRLRVTSGMESVFDRYNESPNLRLTRKRLLETVEFGYLAPDLDACLRNEQSRAAICELLQERLAEGQGVEGQRAPTAAPVSSSLFRHEAEALATIRSRVEASTLGSVLPNLELHDPQSNRYFETDLIVVAPFGIYVVELKHWSGLIEVRPNSWLQNGSFYKPDPHKANGFKAKLVRGLYERKLPHFPSLYVESVVVLTNPETTVEGASIPKTDKNNPTFDSIEGLIAYLKQQRRRGEVLTSDQAEMFADYLQTLHTAGPPRDFVFPGYEVVERLYHHEDRAEVIARRTDVRHRRLSRLRIFFPPSIGAEAEKRASQERATATLNAVAKTGEHPNILKVWPVPNESGYIVEGSDWSGTGTLRDVMADRGRLDIDSATSIAVGILRGLDTIHQQGVIHRALSPENILMVGDVPKLTNFDLSYQLEEDRATVILDASKLTRTPYIAPEVYRSGPLAETADLFSLGVILYRMLTGERPFACSTDLEQTDGELGDQPQRRLGDLDEHVAELIGDLIGFEPASRPSQASEVLKRLERQAAATVEPGAINPELTPGARSGLYEIDELVKHGTQAQIYCARGAHAQQVAIKLFNSDVTLEEVVREQKLAAAVHHACIIDVDSYGRWEEGRFYISFEWVSARRLRDEIADGRQPDPDRFGRIAFQLLDALIALHRHSEGGQDRPILHNDIKPENILFADDDRPVLIDFGCASHPHVGIYEGTEGYVAPDLRLGQDRNYCEDGDLFGVGVALFEWFSGEMPGESVSLGSRPSEVPTEGATMPPALRDWFGTAVASKSSDRFGTAAEMRRSLEEALARGVTSAEEREPPPRPIEEAAGPEDVEPALEYVEVAADEAVHRNAFVGYLNSLHCRDAGNENALAESQARNPLFRYVHVTHPVTDVIQRLLLDGERQHVVLTGHAGDGKSTVAVDLYRRFTHRPVDTPLDGDLKPREDLVVDGTLVAIIKDLSEWSLPDRLALLGELSNAHGPRFLLISNTGTMLATFSEHEKRAEGNCRRAQSEILRLISEAVPKPMQFGGQSLAIVNLSMVDNLGVAERLLERMLHEERWEECRDRACRERCPIFRNVELMRANQDVVHERLFLAYRRMHEYGTRLTLRQLSAHLAYMVTSGLHCRDIAVMSRKAKPPLISEFMFFNRFFGDSGREVDAAALQLQAVRAMRAQDFGRRPCPTWERRLWLQSEATAFTLEANECAGEFEQLRELGATPQGNDALTDTQARLQVRRMLFFLHRLSADSDGAFLRAFLNSPMILDFTRWQESDARLSLGEKTELERNVFHVLQEHFTGVRLPEGACSDRHLFITLSRRSKEIRQSAQVVLARFSEDDFELRLVVMDDGVGSHRRELVLASRNERFDAQLPLGLPFLDYVMMRHQGEVGQDLQTSHVDRLEKFKGQLLRRATSDRADDVMLVRLQTNHTFRRQVYTVRGDRVEVTDG